MPGRVDIMACYAAMAGVSVISFVVDVPIFVQMLVFTVATIYLGCHYALVPEGHAQPVESERMERSDVYLFPIIGSCVLFSLYLVFKIFPRAVLMFVVKLYFLAVGSFVVYTRFAGLLRSVLLPPAQLATLEGQSYSVPLASANKLLNDGRSAYATKVAPTLAPHLATAKTVFDKVAAVAADVYEKAQPLLAAAESKLNSILGEDKSKAKSADAAAPAPAPAADAEPASASPFGFKTTGDNWLPDVLTLTGIDAAAAAFAAFTAAVYIVFNPPWANNVYGVFMSIQAIELLNLGSLLNGTILLAALFFYDVFWVFGTEVMVTVAKNFDAPIKLIFPSSPRPSMLGLGDIVIPGIFIAMTLRYDRKVARPVLAPAKPTGANVPPLAWARYAAELVGSFNPAGLPFRPEYFNVTLLCYAVGILVTLGVMFVFKAAQPALLYLVPACLGAVYGLAFSKGTAEFDAVRDFHDEAPVPDAAAPTAPAVPQPPAPKPLSPAAGVISGPVKAAKAAAESAKAAAAEEAKAALPAAPSADEIMREAEDELRAEEAADNAASAEAEGEEGVRERA